MSAFGPAGPSVSGFYWSRPKFNAAVGVSNPPSPPAALTMAADANDANLSFTWQPPNDDGGSAITKYTLRIFAGTLALGSPVFSSDYPANQTSATVTLDPATTYSATITATNGAGESNQQVSTPASVTTGAAAAAAVVNLITQYAGGFQNGGTILDPAVHGSGYAFTAGDVGGLHYSNDLGRTWQAANDGIVAYQDRYVRGVYGHPTIAGTVYAVRRGAGQVVYKSTQWGQPGTWVKQTSGSFGNGDESNAQPRNVGRVAVAVGSGGQLRHYDATGGGLFRSDDDAKTFALLTGSPTNSQMTGVAYDPQDPTTILVVGTKIHGAAVGGMWLVTHADGAGNPVWTEIKHSGTSFIDGQEVVSVVNPATGNTEFYGAMGVEGIWRLERTSSGNNLTNITGPLPALNGKSDAGWDAIDALAHNGDVLLVAVGGGPASSGSKVWRHEKAGATGYTSAGWFDCVTGGTVNMQLVDANGSNYWLYAGDPSWQIDGNQWDVGAVSICPDNPNTVILFGRSTPVRCDNFLAAKPAWYPSGVGCGALNVNGLAFLPSNPGKGIVVTTDWEWTATSAAAEGFVTSQPVFKHDFKGSGPAWAATVAADLSGYIGHGNDNNGATTTQGGQIVYLANAWTSAALSGTDLHFDTDMGLTAGTLGLPKSILVLFNGSTRHIIVHFQAAYKKDSSGKVLYDVHGCLAHKQGSNAAGKAKDLGSGNGGNYRSRMVAMTDSSGNPTGVVFFYDNDSGIWRSNDWGATWTNLYSLSAGSKNSDWLRVVGSITTIPGSTTLYFTTCESGGGKAWQLTGADTAADASGKTAIATGIDMPSQICYSPDSGRLYIAQAVYGQGGAKLFQGGTGGSFTTFTDKTPPGWAGSCVMPVNLVAANGRLYCLTDGQGVWHVPVPLS